MNKPTLPTEVTLGVDDTITWSQFCKKMSNDCMIKYAKSRIKFTPQIIENLAYICQSEDDLPDDSHPDLWNALEDICKALEKSKEYESMTPEETLETPLEVLEPEVEGTDTIEAPEDHIEPPVTREANSQELLIITEASKVGNEITLEEAKAELEKVFDLGKNNQLRVRGGLPVTPMHIAQGMVYGAKVEQGGSWIYADAVNMLLNLGFEHPMEQIASMLGKSDSTLYNYARTARRIPKELRDESIPITVYSEIVNRKYDEDEDKNTEIITELANQAVKEKWSCNDARSHADMKQGKEPKEKKAKYRYIVILPGCAPYLTVTQPGYSAGAVVLDIKANEYLRDVDNKIEFVPIIQEPTDEQIREMQEGK